MKATDTQIGRIFRLADKLGRIETTARYINLDMSYSKAEQMINELEDVIEKDTQVTSGIMLMHLYGQEVANG